MRHGGGGALDSPQRGDATNRPPWLGLIILACACLVAAYGPLSLVPFSQVSPFAAHGEPRKARPLVVWTHTLYGGRSS